MQIVVSNLCYTSDELNSRPILQDISFTIQNQDIWGIIGPSGAGKTTLGQLMAGLMNPASGEIRTNPPSSPQVGMVFQNPEEQFFEETLLRDARVGLLDSGYDKKTIDVNIKKAFEWVGLGESLGRSPFSLSGGERRLAAIGCVLSADPDIIIFDEPTRGIDVGAKYEIYLLINELAAQGKAIIIVSSELPEILGMSDRIIVMHEGIIRGEITEVGKATQEDILSMAIN